MACEFQSATHLIPNLPLAPAVKFGASLPPRFMKNSYGTTDDIWYTPPNKSCDSDNISDEIFWYTPPQSFSVSLEELNREEVVPVKVMTPTILLQIRRNNILYTKAIIPEEEAVCRFCFVMFPADDDDENSTSSIVLKTNCGCPFTLTHRDCATEWSVEKGNKKCDVCDQDTHYTSVTLSRPRTSKEKHNNNKGSALKKLMCCYSCRSRAED